MCESAGLPQPLFWSMFIHDRLDLGEFAGCQWAIRHGACVLGDLLNAFNARDRDHAFVQGPDVGQGALCHRAAIRGEHIPHRLNGCEAPGHLAVFEVIA